MPSLYLGAVLITLAVLWCAQEAAPAPASPPASAPAPLRALTFNVRYGTAPDGENAWEKRRDLLLQVLEQQNADLVALQEALAFQLDLFLEKFPRYRASGAFRRGGREDEWTGILVDRKRFDVEQEGQFWLSDTPEKVGSTGWDAALPRLCAWAVLAERDGGRRCAVFATHMDHQGEKARLESMRLILARARESAHGLPVLLMGDFNAAEDSPPLRLAREAGFRDSYRVLHPEDKDAGTFHAFTGRTDGAKIDFVLVDAAWDVREAAIVRTAAQGRYPSDHFPVGAVLAVLPPPPSGRQGG